MFIFIPLLCQFKAVVSNSLISYLRHNPIQFEVFGHYQQHPLHVISMEKDGGERRSVEEEEEEKEEGY